MAFKIVKSRRKSDKRKFLIVKDGIIVGRTSQIAIDLRPVIRKRKRKGR